MHRIQFLRARAPRGTSGEYCEPNGFVQNRMTWTRLPTDRNVPGRRRLAQATEPGFTAREKPDSQGRAESWPGSEGANGNSGCELWRLARLVETITHSYPRRPRPESRRAHWSKPT